MQRAAEDVREGPSWDTASDSGLWRKSGHCEGARAENGAGKDSPPCDWLRKERSNCEVVAEGYQGRALYGTKVCACHEGLVS